MFNKPYGVLCQFSNEGRRNTLADYGPFPKDTYPVGRLDADSEGLVLLTNDGLLKHYLLEPKYKHPRTYYVQVERIPSPDALEKLQKGVIIEGRKTLPAIVKLLNAEPVLPLRPVPIRYRKNVPTAWIEMTLFEGKNRQVRKMTASVGYPTLRLVRISIGSISLGKLNPGESRELTKQEINSLLEYCKRKT
ncbi:MAG: pseudouridine synthase [Ignavibacteriales bacterium]|nr:pseudouridine synthase [Ignavibacteriales bacterium]